MRSSGFRIGAGVVGLSLLGAVSFGQSPPPSYGIDFVTVGAPGNPAYDGPDPNGNTIGHGSVPYEFRIGRTEITTAQYLEFYNTFAGTASPPPYFNALGPVFWGARRDLSYPGPGVHYALRPAPDAGMLPVGGLGWFDAALYCNWLQNGKQSDPASLLLGAYDTSLWNIPWIPGGPNTPWSHLPGAQYWIPTLDESLKAAHYDANRYGPGQGGWWLYKNRSDQPGTPGPPGVGTTSAGYQLPDWGEWDIPLGAYPQSQSPWGLLDTSGGAQEWTGTERYLTSFRREFTMTGSYAGQENIELWDAIYGNGSAGPGGTGGVDGGLRIASAIPVPASLAPFCITGLVLFTRKRKGETCSESRHTRPP